MSKQQSEGDAQAELDVAAQRALVARTKTMSELEALAYLAETMRLVASSRPQRNR